MSKHYRVERKRLKARKAFTLVELLVVVAIIVILLAILVPAIVGGMAQAEAAKCAANIKAIGTGAQMFALSEKNKLPSAEWSSMKRPEKTEEGNHSWHADANGNTGISPVAAATGVAAYSGGELWPYVSSEDAFIGPCWPGAFDSLEAQGHFEGNDEDLDAGWPGYMHSEAERGLGLTYTMHASCRVTSGKPPEQQLMGDYGYGWFGVSLRKLSGPWRDGNGHAYPLKPSTQLIYTEQSLWPHNPHNAAKRNDQMFNPRRYVSQGVTVWETIGDMHPKVPSAKPEEEGSGNVWFLDGHVDRHSASETDKFSFPNELIDEKYLEQ